MSLAELLCGSRFCLSDEIRRHLHRTRHLARCLRGAGRHRYDQKHDNAAALCEA